MLSFGADLCAGVVCMPDAACNPATGWCRQLTYEEQLKKDPTGGTMEAGQRAQVLGLQRQRAAMVARVQQADLDIRDSGSGSAAPTPSAAGGAGMALAALAAFLLFK